MSATKGLARLLKRWTPEEMANRRLAIEADLKVQKNPMRRASLQEQLRMIEAAEKKAAEKTAASAAASRPANGTPGPKSMSDLFRF